MVNLIKKDLTIKLEGLFKKVWVVRRCGKKVGAFWYSDSPDLSNVIFVKFGG